jgi:hypothetical protein
MASLVLLDSAWESFEEGTKRGKVSRPGVFADERSRGRARSLVPAADLAGAVVLIARDRAQYGFLVGKTRGLDIRAGGTLFSLRFICC